MIKEVKQYSWIPWVDNPEYQQSDLDYFKQLEQYKREDAIKMSMHADWKKIMEDLKVGDIVSTFEGKIGIITEVTPMDSFGFKQFSVLVEGNIKYYFSMSLKKIGEQNG